MSSSRLSRTRPCAPFPRRAQRPQPRSFFDKLNEWARSEGAPGLGYIEFDEENGALIGKGPIAKFIPAAALADMAKLAKVKAGDALFFAADKAERAAKLAGLARTRIGHELGLIKEDVYKFCWIVDFPMYEWNEDGAGSRAGGPGGPPRRRCGCDST